MRERWERGKDNKVGNGKQERKEERGKRLRKKKRWERKEDIGREVEERKKRGRSRRERM